jgi:hypothetical protein
MKPHGLRLRGLLLQLLVNTPPSWPAGQYSSTTCKSSGSLQVMHGMPAKTLLARLPATYMLDA